MNDAPVQAPASKGGRKLCRRIQTGFTVVELIVIMVLIGVISAIAAPRLMDDGSTAANVFGNEVASALRYAQKSAVAHRRIVCANIGASQITLTIAVQSIRNAPAQINCSAPLPGPIEADFKSNDSTVTAGGTWAGQTLFFQPDGTISSDFAGTTVVGAGTVQVMLKGATQRTIYIEGVTGRVE